MSDWIIRREVLQAHGGVDWMLRALEDGIERGSVRVRLPRAQPGARFWYRIGVTSHGAAAIGIQRLQKTLTLCSDLIGATELAQASAGDARTASLLLHAAEFWLGMAADPTPVYMEFAAVRRAGAASTPPSRLDTLFFEDVSRHFLPAGRASLNDAATAWPAELTGLLPRHPLFLELLQADLAAVIGQAAPEMAHWVDAARWHGLRADAWLNVLDGGPIYHGWMIDPARPGRVALRTVHAADAPRSDSPPAAPALVKESDSDTLHVLPARLDNDRIVLAADDAPADTGMRQWCMALRLPEAR